MGIHTEAVQKLYVAYFSRPADAAGLAYWEGVVAAQNGSTAAVSAAFAGSQEYKDTFAGQSAYQIINTIYMNLFGRPAEAAALTFWGQGLLNNAFTIDAAVTTIAGAAVGTDLTAYNSKVSAATSFTAALDTPAEMIGYSGTAANNAAKTWLTTVVNADTLAAAIAPAALAATVIAVTNPPIVGGTFSLTTGVDTLPGTSANDTFNALSVNASGAAETLTAFDAIDGAAGNDTLNIYTTATENEAAPANLVVTNVETVNVYNTAAAAALGDASKFTGVTNLNQIGANAAAVTNLATTTTAGFDGTTSNISVSGNSSAASVSVSLKGVSDGSIVTLGGAKLAGVNLTGTLVDGADVNTSVDSLAVQATAGTDVTSFTINSAISATVVVNNGNKTVTTIDASTSTGAITNNAGVGVTTLRGGSAGDTLSISTTTVAAATGVTAVSALVDGGAGNDAIEVKTTGNGATTVEGGAGDDTVVITTRGTGKLTVNLGDGADSFTTAVGQTVNAGDAIDAGAGVDTLALSLVGAANIGAFSNFDSFDAKDLNRTLDVEILASKNTVSEIVASGNTGTAVLTNVGAGVGVRVTGDMGASTLGITQKTAGALTITVDADETGAATDAGEIIDATLSTNATSVKAVFDTTFLADTTAEKALAENADNYSILTITAADATSMEVVSGGNGMNELNLTGTAKLASIVVTGSQKLYVNSIADVTKLTSIDASAATGGLDVSTNDVANGGTIKLGSGVDEVVLSASSLATSAGIEQVSGFEKAAAAAVGSDATAATAAQADADTLVFLAGATVANANAGVTTGTISKGVLTFTGAGPGTLDEAFGIANAAAETDLEVVVFEYLGNSYVFQQNGGADVAIKLVGITGITNLAEVGTTDGFFIV